MILQERDIKIFRYIRKYQFLTTSQIKGLVFPDNYITIARRRLRKLVVADYVGTIELLNKNGTLKEYIYYLKKNACAALDIEYKKKSHPKTLLAHTVEMISVQIHFEKAYQYRNDRYSIRDFQNERKFIVEGNKRFRAIYDKFFSPKIQEYITVTPDIKFVLERKVKDQLKSNVIFIEVDRGTEDLGKIRKKVKAYYEYFTNSGKKFKKKFEATSDHFRVLFITTTHRRINNILKSLKMEYGLDLFVFTTFEDFYNTKDLTEAIWMQKSGNKAPLIKQKKPFSSPEKAVS